MSRLTLKVTPNARRSEILGPVEIAGSETALAIKLKAPPIDGKANRVLIAFLADTLGIPKNAVTILRGEKNRIKLVEITGVSGERLRSLGEE